MTSIERAVAWTLSRRVTVLTLALLLVAIGWISMKRLPVELAPRGFTTGEVTINIPVNASNPVEVQETVIRPTEELLRTIPGITKITSRARKDAARISIEFSRDVDADLAAAEVRDRVERARPSWPSDVRRYFLFRFNLDSDLPVYSFGLTLDRPGEEATFLVEERILKPLEAIPGVARVTCWGLLDDQVRIYVDRDRALASGVDLYQLTQALERANLDVPGGEIREGDVRYSLKSDGRFRSIEDVKAHPVRPGLPLGTLADVRAEKAVRDFVALSGTRPSLWCQVQKESTANTVETCERVRTMLRDRISKDPRLAELGLGFLWFERMDFGKVITGAVDQLKQSTLEGACLAVVVLLLFLKRFRLTLIITLAIPLSLLITAAAMDATGASLNILSLLGITIAIGMLVDDAIVVVECIQQHRDRGLPPMRAARMGTAEVALPVTLSTLTTVLAFLPIIFMSGRQEVTFFTSAIGMPLVWAVLASLVVALVFVPLATVALTRGKFTDPAWIVWFRSNAFFDRIAGAYGRSVGAALKRRFALLFLSTAFCGGLSWWAWSLLPKTDVMSDAGGGINIEIELDANYSLQEAYDTFVTLGKAVERVGPEIGLDDFWSFFRDRGGSMNVYLAHRDPDKTKAAIETLRKALPRIPGAKVQVGLEDREGGAKQRTSFQVFGPNLDKLEVVAREVAEEIGRMPGILKTKCDLEPAEDEIHVVPNRARLQRFGISSEALTGTIGYGVRGFPLAELASGDREIPLIIQFEGGDTQRLSELRETPLFTKTGARVPMSAVAEIVVTRGFGEIRREGGRARANIAIDTNETDTQGLMKRIRERLARFPLPEGFSYEDTAGASFEDGMKELGLATLLAAVFVFLIMGIMFESFLLPFVIILSVPFAWCGALWALAFTKTPLDLVGSIAAILLVGIVVKNGIVLIDCARRLMDEGLARDDALKEAGRVRLRPILMTAATTILGLVPTAIAVETGSTISYKALAVATIGGMTVATLLQLYVVPAIFAALDDARSLCARILGFRTPATETHAERDSDARVS